MVGNCNMNDGFVGYIDEVCWKLNKNKNKFSLTISKHIA